ncbi:MAG: efflux RND transporter periplasmic adaptor subunit [Deltaproteobacteria bacterium]|nr:efflux RND transporter periplasmic adaptor subunit [Deltaproteobacteria bacterium]
MSNPVSSPRRGSRLVLAALVVAGAASLVQCKKPAEATEEVVQTVPVAVAVVGRGTVREVARYTGEVRPSMQVNVLPRMAEKILELGFDIGDTVTQDETVMARLATAVVDTGVRQARSGAEALTAQINGLKTQRERIRRLVSDGVVSASQLDPLDTQISALEAQRRQVLAGVDQANLRVDDTVVKAPMTGFISQRYVEVGDMVSPASPLGTIVRLDPAYVWIDVPEHELELVRAQTTVAVRVQSAPDRAFAGTVDLVSPNVDRESRSVRIRYVVDNPEMILRDGMLAVVEVELRRRDDVLVAPTDALILDPTQRGAEASYAAWVVRDGKALRLPVRRGLLEGARTEVLEGLAEGDRLVVEGFHMLDPDAAVEVVREAGGTEAAAATAATPPAPPAAPPDDAGDGGPVEPADGGGGEAGATP